MLTVNPYSSDEARHPGPLQRGSSVEQALPFPHEKGRQIVDSQTLMVVGIAVAILILIAADGFGASDGTAP